MSRAAPRKRASYVDISTRLPEAYPRRDVLLGMIVEVFGPLQGCWHVEILHRARRRAWELAVHGEDTAFRMWFVEGERTPEHVRQRLRDALQRRGLDV